MTRSTADAIDECFGSSSTENVNVVDALLEIASAINALARTIDRLGTNGASTPMGAIELLALEVKNAGESLANSIGELSNW